MYILFRAVAVCFCWFIAGLGYLPAYGGIMIWGSMYWLEWIITNSVVAKCEVYYVTTA